MPSIMMCDDHAMVMNAMGDLLRKENFKVIATTLSGKACIEAIQSGLIPNVLILDISMPDMPGYIVAQHVKKHYPNTKILIFSMITDENAVKAMIRIGVNGFAFKNISDIELVEIIRKISSGQEYYPPEFIFSTEEIEIIKQQKIAWAEQLTKKEIQATQLLANDLSRKQVAEDMGISASSINKKMERVFKKTNQKSTVGVINFLKKVGIIQ
ncbi:response regulator transcription factor [Sediminibacterium sp.]|uniref:response regulator transcription factor n=1 Tax=Sediminibacterium sp. TaxID=1917865 RepID=UPI002732DAF4|nr:response regulator transcription factor [Sediminibacterium sp.]MDP3394321.1 response regulator transcription factor [Sediminibacterium sp.]MDP3568156.1 response regulator transcription factor [Sediminibacterium sp.]